MLTLTYEYKALPTNEQIQLIEHTLTLCRKVWNFALRERKDWLNSRKSSVNACSVVSEYIMPVDIPYPNWAIQCKSLTAAKEQFPELKTVNAQVLQQVLRKLETAFVDMTRKKMGFPRFKNRYRMRSFVYPQLGKGQLSRGNQIKLPQLGWLEYVKSREIPDGFAVKQARIVRKASGYFVMLILECDVSVPNPVPSGHPVGIDLGLDKFAATSDGELIERPRFLKTLHRKLKLLQRRLKHKKKGSNNRHKLTRKIARLHQRIADTRKDWHFKLAHKLCNDAGMVFVEDIDFRVLAKGMLGKHTLDAGFGQFVSILQWVCWKRGVYFDEVNKNYTSQVCPSCDTHTGKKDLSNRIHSCPHCGYITHRDVAAAQIIRNRGLVQLSEVGRVLDIKERRC
ncbi:MAG: transposase [Microcoleus sp. PH2017_10_PVI_O_A]|uniref:RNA-guided endonuclease InsQ/TnpB family protein n=1 Tax=unclassified Microcoleus TaxID=2642155 RepID=UPI001D8FC6F1|nr:MULTISPECIES: transposase [unclassified Microcoleus]TAE73794.1 MAG: transposase [Oscillatoriales cyanobacterium]MCC3409878.1 transposase [Microcoleus sp. PH2017_10_PVI_O_A]MCC3464141.1 transposase [Microcoleus sp. PH2017_11_PCY_U_A]MCC3482481.1 transposase [Microcoleus sp. PH2017_12_PCY_D_A]MCC3531900.1 transposase [Microcoleus sp. PH2017_21_RUC_O_A]